MKIRFFFLLLMIAAPLLAGCTPAVDWGPSEVLDLNAVPSSGVAGCPVLGDISVSSDQITFSTGFELHKPLPEEALHGHDETADGSTAGFALAGVVLVGVAARTESEQDLYSILPASSVVRIAKRADELTAIDNVSFDGVTLPQASFECGSAHCHTEVKVTFVVCWDDPVTGARAYQILDVAMETPTSSSDGCPVVDGPGGDTATLLRANAPLLDAFTSTSESFELLGVPKDWASWIDEELPRP